MDWHLTWQDPVAIVLVVLVILGSRWLKRRLEPVGCGACAHAGAGAPSGPMKPTRVPVERMRLHDHNGRQDHSSAGGTNGGA